MIAPLHGTWVPLILLSAALLGIYDVAKKHAVAGNAVIPVLALATLTGTIVVTCAQLLTGTIGQSWCITPHQFLLLFTKSIIVAGSWICAYYAMRELPITIIAPLRGSQPIWTLTGALLLFGEMPSPLQWMGISIIILGYWLFSVMGRLEGIHFTAHKGVLLIFIATILGAASGLYDKYLLQPCQLQPGMVQLWFQIDLVVIIGTVWFLQRRAGLIRTPFTWRYSIILTGMLLAAADWLYFTALHQPDTLISVLSPLRRSNAIVSFLVGGYLFNDVNRKKKGVALGIIIIGLILLCLPELL